MTLQSPRIYVYKITFDEVDHYYYGLHKEKKFDEYYMGSPVTHKDFWQLYTPKKEYIEFFDYSDDGYTEARIFEDSLIAPVLNDELCLNEHVGGSLSLEARRNAGKIGGKVAYEKGIGVHALTKEERIENGKKYGKIGGRLGGSKSYELKVGVHSWSKEQFSENGKKSGKIAYERGLGVHNRSKKQIIEDGKKGGKLCYEKGIGVHALTKEEKIENGKKGAKAQHSQRWKCTVTGYESTPTGLSHYQRKRKIDPKNRIRIK
jgi:hypothetical protein